MHFLRFSTIVSKAVYCRCIIMYLYVLSWLSHLFSDNFRYYCFLLDMDEGDLEETLIRMEELKSKNKDDKLLRENVSRHVGLQYESFTTRPSVGVGVRLKF